MNLHAQALQKKKISLGEAKRPRGPRAPLQPLNGHPGINAQRNIQLALDRSPRVRSQLQLQEALNRRAEARITGDHQRTAFQQPPVQRVRGVIQRANDDFQGEELKKLQQIAERMGVDPGKISFKRSKESTSRTKGNKIYVGTGLIDGNEATLEFVIGHELSHYKTGDVWPISGVNPYMMTAGALGLLLGGPYSALAGGLLGFGGELAAGGGLINALVTGVSTAGMIGLGPLGSWLGGTAGGLLGAAAGSLVSLPAVFKLLEIKSDLHSAKNFGPEGGIARFRSVMTDNKYDQPSFPTMKEGNSIFDPTHPPLSTRVGYLELLQKLMGTKED